MGDCKLTKAETREATRRANRWRAKGVKLFLAREIAVESVVLERNAVRRVKRELRGH